MAISVADTRVATLDKDALKEAITQYLLSKNQTPAANATIALLVDSEGYNEAASNASVVSVTWPIT